MPASTGGQRWREPALRPHSRRGRSAHHGCPPRAPTTDGTHGPKWEAGPGATSPPPPRTGCRVHFRGEGGGPGAAGRESGPPEPPCTGAPGDFPRLTRAVHHGPTHAGHGCSAAGSPHSETLTDKNPTCFLERKRIRMHNFRGLATHVKQEENSEEGGP